MRGRACWLGGRIEEAPYGSCLLRDRKDVLHALVYASRVERIRCSRHRNELATEAVLDARDAERAAFIRHYFHSDWGDRHLYHLLLNSNVGVDTAASVIVNLAGSFHPANGARGTAAEREQDS